jgi:hypothetical protein
MGRHRLGWIGLQRMAAIVSSDEAEIVALADPVKDLVNKAGELAPKAARMRTLQERSFNGTKSGSFAATAAS